MCCCLALFVTVWLQPQHFQRDSLACCMPSRTVSRDLKARIPSLFHQQGFKIKEICAILGVKKTVVYQTLSYARAYGVPYNPHAHKPGRKRVLSKGDLDFIVALLNCRHCLYLNKIQEQLCNKSGTLVLIIQ